ncbi:MAG: hypothetical protein B7Z37_29580 [Verrucomicrobia bacterium 12-59-8]|nr:MAG: hypothetical protein B7Z37_29580 [Verrucomicrobia bacterium 12-59-8]
MGGVIQLFGKLASQAGAPVVLVLDQLDLVVTQPQFDEMQRLLFALIDQSENWVVLIGLVAERFAAWDAALTQALRGRVGVPDSNAPLGFRLPVIDMLPIANEQKRLLLNCRLDTPALVEQRKKDGITSAIHPLLDEDVARLTAGGAIFPRHLLAAAAEAFALRTAPSALPPEIGAVVAAQPSLPSLPPPVPAEVVPMAVAVVEAAKEPPAVAAIPVPAALTAPKTSLAEKMDALLQQAVAVAKAEAVTPTAIDLGERARDLIELMVAPPVTTSEGDIRKSYDNFDGSDRWFEWGGSKVRVVTSKVLERIKEAAGDTLLLRNYNAPVSGQLTMELLNTFKSKNTFHHMTPSEAAILAALGSMLAAQREGSYDQLATEPPATKDNVLAALRVHPLLRGLRLWDMIQQVHAPKQAPPGPPQSSVLSSIVRPSVMPVTPPPMAPVAKPPVVPGAKPPLPPPFTGATKPLAIPPSAPVSKPIAKPPAPPMAKPPPGAARPPMAKLPPPSQGNAA